MFQSKTKQKNESNKIFRNEYIKTMRYTFIGFLSFLLALYLIDFTNLYFVKDKILSMQNFILLFINFSLMQALTSLSYFFRLRDKDPASRLYLSANILSLLVSIWTCSFFGIKGLLITNLQRFWAILPMEVGKNMSVVQN
jgi:heme/copper-type cytochrome/quinol oxidase subunit 4